MVLDIMFPVSMTLRIKFSTNALVLKTHNYIDFQVQRSQFGLQNIKVVTLVG